MADSPGFIALAALFVVCALSVEGTKLQASQWAFIQDFAKALGKTSPWKISTQVPNCESLAGVSCYDSGMIDSLDMSGMNLEGKIPDSIGNLKKVYSVDFSSNSLSGSIPQSLGKLAALQQLYLSDNSLTGKIPDSFGNLTALYTLYLDGNSLTGSIPRTITNLKALQYLYCASNMLSGPIPKNIGDLVNLRQFTFSSNQLTGSIPTSLTKMTELRQLYLDQNLLEGPIPQDIGALSKVFELLLSVNKLTGNIPGSIEDMHALQRLYLNYNELEGEIPYYIGSLSRLLELNLASNKISGEIPDTVGLLSGLQLLDLSTNSLEGYIPSSFKNLVNLYGLDLDSNSLNGSIPLEIGRLTNLKYIYLNDNSLEGVIPDFFQNLSSSLIEISLANNSLSGSIPPSIASLTDLNVLDLSNNYLTGHVDLLLSLSNPDAIYIDDNYFTGVLPKLKAKTQVLTANNCFSNVRKSDWNGDCQNFCNTLRPEGPCGGHGRCNNDSNTNEFTCACDPSFILQKGNKFNCVYISKYKTGFVPSPSSSFSFLNTFSRHVSYNFVAQSGKWLIGSSADWRLDTQGIRDQGNCSSSWAIAPLSAFETLLFLVAPSFQSSNNGSSLSPVLSLFSPQQILDCNPFASSSPSSFCTCLGGWPEGAFSYIASQNGSLVPDGVYKSMAKAAFPPATCNSNQFAQQSSPALSGVMFEKVDFFGWFGVLIALQQQPVVAFVRGSYPSFQLYKTGTFSDPSCFPSSVNYTPLVDHAVVLVGYELRAFTPYWVLRNSWGMSWGLSGDMWMAITGGDGLCGVHSLPALYPAISAPSPCDNPINPCGGGDCIPIPGSNKNWCSCPGDNFVNVTNIDGTQTCAIKSPCSASLFNPCAAGSCVDDPAGGSYSCVCPPGYQLKTRAADGSQACAWVAAWSSQQKISYTVQRGVTCPILLSTFGLSSSQLLKQNPGLSCNGVLKANSVLNVTPLSSFKCTLYYSWGKDDNCTIVLSRFSLASSFAKLNPGIPSCSSQSLTPGQQVCVSSLPSLHPFSLCDSFSPYLPDGATCQAAAKSSSLSFPLGLFSLNPGLYCGSLSPPRRGSVTFTPPSARICVSGVSSLPSKCASGGKFYSVKAGDSCASLTYYQFKGDTSKLSDSNSGFACNDAQLYVGMQLCVPAK